MQCSVHIPNCDCYYGCSPNQCSQKNIRPFQPFDHVSTISCRANGTGWGVGGPKRHSVDSVAIFSPINACDKRHDAGCLLSEKLCHCEQKWSNWPDPFRHFVPTIIIYVKHKFRMQMDDDSRNRSHFSAVAVTGVHGNAEYEMQMRVEKKKNYKHKQRLMACESRMLAAVPQNEYENCVDGDNDGTQTNFVAAKIIFLVSQLDLVMQRGKHFEMFFIHQFGAKNRNWPNCESNWKCIPMIERVGVVRGR